MGSGVIAPPFFTLALDGGEGELHTPAALPVEKERVVSTGGSVSARAGLDAVK
jgi:hypothetical protein